MKKTFGICSWCKKGTMTFLSWDYYPMCIAKCSNCHHESQEVLSHNHPKKKSFMLRVI